MSAGDFRRLKRAAAKLGVCVESKKAFDYTTIDLSAPHRHLFVASSTHFLVCDLRSVTYDEAAAQLLPDLAGGLKPCGDEGCDICEPEAEPQP